MAIDRPDDLPTWAEAGSAVAPPGAKQDTGWLFEEPPPFELVNWFWRQLSRWVAHFADSSSTFDNPNDAYDASLPGSGSPFSLGGSCLIRGIENELGSPGDVLATASLGDEQPTTPGTVFGRLVPVAGRGVIAMRLVGGAFPFGSEVVRFSNDLVEEITYFTGAVGQSVFYILSDGLDVTLVVSVAGITDSELREYDYDTGALKRTTILPAAFGAVHDMVWSADFIYVAQGNHVHRIRRDVAGGSGVIDWSFDHGATVENVAVFEEGATGAADRGIVVLSGDASSFASGATIRGISLDGKDKDGEGGIGTFLGGWTDTDIPTFQTMISDSRVVYRTGPGPGLLEQVLQIRSPITGDIVKQISNFPVSPGNEPTWVVGSMVDVDQDYLYFSNSGTLPDNAPWSAALDKRTLSTEWLIGNPGLAPVVPALASDGFDVFVIQGDAVAVSVIRKIRRNNRTQLWRRIDPRAGRPPFRAPMVPVDG